MPLDSDPIIDWAKWTDERPHVLVRGDDFARDVRKVRKAAGMWAHRHGYRCLTETTDARLVVQFVPREA